MVIHIIFIPEVKKDFIWFKISVSFLINFSLRAIFIIIKIIIFILGLNFFDFWLGIIDDSIININKIPPVNSIINNNGIHDLPELKVNLMNMMFVSSNIINLNFKGLLFLINIAIIMVVAMVIRCIIIFLSLI